MLILKMLKFLLVARIVSAKSFAIEGFIKSFQNLYERWQVYLSPTVFIFNSKVLCGAFLTSAKSSVYLIGKVEDLFVGIWMDGRQVFWDILHPTR